MKQVVARKMAEGTWHLPTRAGAANAKRSATLRAKALGNTRLRVVGNKTYRQVMTREGYRYEHRVAMEQALGRKLERWEHVHHINEDGLDNRPENLELLTVGQHTSHHFKGKPKSAEHRAKIAASNKLARANRP